MSCDDLTSLSSKPSSSNPSPSPSSSIGFPSVSLKHLESPQLTKEYVSIKTNNPESIQWYSFYKNQFNTSGIKKDAYDTHIAKNREEQERVQKKTFTNWINSYLAKHIPPLHTVDLIEDLKDGTRLLALLSVLSGEKLVVEKGRNLRRPHFLSNCNTALNFLQSKRLKLVNINSSDIVDGKPAVVLGLVWTIILYFQLRCRDRKVIEENTKVLASLSYRIGSQSTTETPVSAPTTVERPPSRAKTESPATVVQTKTGRITPAERWKEGARKALLQWVQDLVNKRFNLNVKDFGGSWRDGWAFLAIINAIKPGLVDMDSFRNVSNKTRLEAAFRLGEQLGIPRLLDPEDVDVPRPDEKSVMTYVAQFLHKANSSQADNFASTQAAYDELLTWLNQKTQYMEHMKQTNGLSMDYRDYLNLKHEFDSKVPLYDKIKKLMESSRMIGVTEDAWNQIDTLWKKLESQLKEWLWLLDSNLPPPFGVIGQWLAQAELLLTTSDVPSVMDDEAARVLNRKIEDHKAFFGGLPNVISDFSAGLSSPVVNTIPSEEIESIANRLSSIGSQASKRLINLKYLEHKCCLVAFLALVENRLRGWRGKYGRNVQGLLNQFNTFVNRNHVFTEFERAYADMQLVVEEYKREGGIDLRESRVADHFLWEVGERWKSLSLELRCVGSMLEEVIAHWRRYDTLYPEIENWLVQSIPILQYPHEDKINYFQDVGLWQEKFEILRDTVAFLVATSDPEVTGKIQKEFEILERNWTDFFHHVKHYQQTGEVMRLRKDFISSVSLLQSWLEDGERILATPFQNLTTETQVSEFVHQLLRLQSEIDGMDEKWREINRKFQGFLPQLSGEDVDGFMKIIKKEKERLISVRSQIPIRHSGIQSIVAEENALRAGLEETADWILKGQELLNKYSPHDMRTAQETLLQHRKYFSKLVYYRTMLESKKRFAEGRVGDSEQLNEVTDAFHRLEKRSNEIESGLNEGVRCWRNYEENKQTVCDWLSTAENLLTNRDLNSRESLELQKGYFQQINERPLRDLVQSAQGLRNCIQPQMYEGIVKSVEHCQIKWKKIMSQAPLHLRKLEFHLEKETLYSLLTELKNEIKEEEILLRRHEKPEILLARNTELLGGDLPLLARTSLERLIQIQKHLKTDDDQSNLGQEVSDADQVFQGLLHRASILSKKLQDIPDQWELYKQKFEEVSCWMDDVDSSLKKILNQGIDANEFEKGKTKFLDICREVDLKREDMKMLVKELDHLVSMRPDEEALQEQTSLENLIQRYKNLVPMIEVTMIKTETQSRCYSYREETKRICKELEGLGHLEDDTFPSSLEQIRGLISQQHLILSQLETQRPTIINLIQTGKTLQNDTNSPEFIQNEVQELDLAWKEIYDNSHQKLINLQKTEKVWKDFVDHKLSILNLLEDAQIELNNFSPKDLQKKEELSSSLRHATEITLDKLRDLARNLCHASRPEVRGLLEHEIQDIERRLHEILRLLDGRILETSNQNLALDSIVSKIQDLSKDVEFCKAALLQLLNMEILPDERIRRVEEINLTITQKLIQLEELQKSLGQVGESGDGKVENLTKDVATMKEGLSQVHESVVAEAAESQQALVTWTQSKDQLQKATPWIEEASQKVARGLPRPATLEEAKLVKAQIKEITNEGKLLAAQLSHSVELVQQIPSLGQTAEEVNLTQRKLSSINSTAETLEEKTDGLIDKWEKYDSTYKKMDDWLMAELDSIQTPKNYAELSPEEINEQETKLQLLCEKLRAQEPEISSLSKECDYLIRHTAPQAGTALNTDLKMFKQKTAKLAEATQAQMNALEVAKEAREAYQTKAKELAKWMGEFGKAVEEGEIRLNSLEHSASQIQLLREELQVHQPEFDKVYEEVKTLSLTAPSPEIPILSQEFSNLAQTYQDIQNKLGIKTGLLKNWKELETFETSTTEALHHITKRLHFPTPGVQVPILEIETELSILNNKLEEWMPKAKEMDKTSQNSGVVVRGTLEQPITANNVLTKLKDKTDATKIEIKKMKDKTNALKSEWEKVNAAQEALASNLAKSQQALISLVPSKIDKSSMQQTLDGLQKLKESQVAGIKAEKVTLHSLAEGLVQKDPTTLEPVHGILLSTDKNVEEVEDLISKQVTAYAKTIDLWKKYEDEKQEIKNVLTEIEKMEEDGLRGVPSDGETACLLLDHLKKSSLSLDRKKPLLNQCIKSNTELLNQLKSLPNVNQDEIKTLESEIPPLINQMTSLTAQLGKKILKTETEIVLWSGIEEGKKDLITWLSNVYETLKTKDESPVNPIEIRKDLTTIGQDLTHKMIQQKELQDKINQLQNLNPNTVIPSLGAINELIEEGFYQVGNLLTALQSKLSNFEIKEGNLKTSAKDLSEKLRKLKLINIKDKPSGLTGIGEKLQQLKQAKIEGEGILNEANKINESVSNLKSEYETWDDLPLKKETSNLISGIETIINQAEVTRTGLLNSIEKDFSQKFSNLNRQLEGAKEKLEMCNPSNAVTPTRDVSDLKSDLEDVSVKCEEIQRLLPELDEILKLYESVMPLEKSQPMKTQYAQIVSSLNTILETVKNYQSQTGEIDKVGVEFTNLSNAINTSITEVEEKIKNIPTFVDKSEIPKQIQEIASFPNLKLLEPQLAKLNILSNELKKLSPNSPLLPILPQLIGRHQTAIGNIDEAMKRFKGLEGNILNYNTTLEKIHNFVEDGNKSLKPLHDILSKSGKPVEATKTSLSDLLKSKIPQSLLEEATKESEASIIPYLNSESKEIVRNQLKTTRSKWEEFLDNGNKTLRGIEARELEWGTAEESKNQVIGWLDGIKTQKIDILQPNLPQKKKELERGKILLQDLISYAPVIQALGKKLQDLGDQNEINKFQIQNNEYEKLKDEMNKGVGILGNNVQDHEKYEKMKQDVIELIKGTEGTFTGLNELPISSKDIAKEKLNNIIKLKNVEDEILNKIKDCEKTLKERILPQTHPNGHSKLQNEIQELQNTKDILFEKIKDVEGNINSQIKEMEELTTNVENLKIWLKDKENQVKDQTLRSTVEAKQERLNSLSQIREEVIGKAPEFGNLREQMKRAVERDATIPQILFRYEALPPAIKDAETKYKEYTTAHHDFDNRYTNLLKMLENLQSQLNDLKGKDGKMTGSEGKKKLLGRLFDEYGNGGGELEEVQDCSERLYSQTSPDGREIIRQEIRRLRDIWDTLGDDLQSYEEHLSLHLNMLEDFGSAQNELSKFLKEIEEAMETNTLEKDTIQEKENQRKKHSDTNQEIIRKEDLVNTVCHRAKQLVQITEDEGLNSFISSIQQLFQRIKSKSAQLLQKLEKNVITHKHLDDAVKELNNWIVQQSQKLTEIQEPTGEKSELLKRIQECEYLIQEGEKGNELFNKIKEVLPPVLSSTSTKGKQNIEDEIKKSEEKLKDFNESLKATWDKLKKFHNQWTSFETELANQTQWLKDGEQLFRNQPLYATLPQKESALQELSNTRISVVDQEPKINAFIDKAHELSRTTKVERVKQLAMQLSNRFQLLHVLSKDSLNRQELNVQNHRTYDQIYQELVGALENLDKDIQSQKDKIDFPSLLPELQKLKDRKNECEKKLDNASTLAEKLFPETNAEGREKIRSGLHNLKEKLDKFEDILNGVEKKAEADSKLHASYNESLREVKNWLRGIESLVNDNKTEWISPQDTRGKIIKLKLGLEDTESKRGLMDGLEEKAKDIIKKNLGENPKEIEKVVEDLKSRYENLSIGLLNGITSQEKILDTMQDWDDLAGKVEDIQKGVWEELEHCPGPSGEKVGLAAAIKKFEELRQKLGEAVPILQSMDVLLKNLPSTFSQRNLESLRAKERNYKFEQEKLGDGIIDAVRALEEGVRAWTNYESGISDMVDWLGSAENTLKSLSLKDTLQEKEKDVEKYKGVLREIDERTEEVKNILFLTQNVEQCLGQTIREKENNFDKLRSTSPDFIGSGDTQTQTQVKQIDSRFQTIHKICKEILKKCEEDVKDHRQFEEEAKTLGNELQILETKLNELDKNIDGKEGLEKQIDTIRSLALQKVPHQKRLNNLTELGEKLFNSTGHGGIQGIQSSINGISDLFNSVYDNVALIERNTQENLTKWLLFEENESILAKKLKGFKQRLPPEIELKSTLDEKRQLLNTHRVLVNDITSSLHEAHELKEKSTSLPNSAGASLVNDYEELLKIGGNRLTAYEWIVGDHNQYMNKVHESEDFFAGVGNTVSLWSDLNQDRLTLQSNLHRLQNLLETLPEEGYRIEEIGNLGQKVIPNTAEEGRKNIEQQIQASKNQWEGTTANVKASIDALQRRVSKFANFEEEKEKCLEFLKDAELKMHAELQPTLELKQKQLDLLQTLQGEVKARELEVDSIREKAISLQTQAIPSRKTGVSDLELTAKYQEVTSRVKEQTGNWKIYVAQHQDLNSDIKDCERVLEEMNKKLESCLCSDSSPHNELEGKLSVIKELLVRKDDVSSKIQGILGKAQGVLTKTSPDGHPRINSLLEKIQSEYSNLAAKSMSCKTMIEECIHRWAGFLEQLEQLDKILSSCEDEIQKLSEPKTTLQEQGKQLQTIRVHYTEKLSSERNEVETLKSKVEELTPSDKKTKALGTIRKYDDVSSSLRQLLIDKENEYKFHKGYKDAHEELITWLGRIRDRIPKSSKDQFPQLETATATYISLMNKKPQGTLLLDQLQQLGDLVLATASPDNPPPIKSEIKTITESLEELFKEIQDGKNSLANIMSNLNEWKEEYEKLSDWLQQNDILLKNVKTTLPATLEEKKQKVIDTTEVVSKLANGKKDIESFNTSTLALKLLKSPMENYVSTQIQRLHARYQVQLTIGNDLLKKVENTYDCHNEYLKALERAKDWTDKALELLHECAETTSSSRKERIQEYLDKVQEMIRIGEEDKSLLNSVLEWSEKALRDTRSDGKETIKTEVQNLQTDWERMMKKLTSAKASMNQKLLEWADYNSSYTLAKEWLNEREAKLEKVVKGGSQSKKANLRAASTIVQDIASLEPIIETLSTKAKTLMNDQPVVELTTQYEKLVNSAQEVYAKQKVAVELDQEFGNLVHEFMSWIYSSKERLGKICEPSGDISVKISQVTVLVSELPDGQSKLNSVLSKGNEACNVLTDDERDIIEQQVAVCAEEFDFYSDGLEKKKRELELGLVGRKGFEERLKRGEEWLKKEEESIRELTQPHQTLQEKKVALEKFQLKLQEVFDWQKELDILHMEAQDLLSTIPDSRISNAVTEISTKYNALLSLSKEVIRRLELQYQEHQQYQALSEELSGWITDNKNKLENINTKSFDQKRINQELQNLNGMKQNLEQGHNKLRYAEELKEKVLSNIINLPQITNLQSQQQIYSCNLQENFDKLINLYEDTKQKLRNHGLLLQNLQVEFNAIENYLNETNCKIINIKSIHSQQDLEEKRSSLEKGKSLLKEVEAHSEMIDKFQEKLSNLSSIPSDSPYLNIKNRYDDLKNQLEDLINSIEILNESQEKYWKLANEITNKLSKHRLQLQQLSDTHGDKILLISREKELENFENELIQDENDLKLLKEYSEKACETMTEDSKEPIWNKTRGLQSEFDRLMSQFIEGKKDISRTFDAWNEYEELMCKLSKDFNENEQVLNEQKQRMEVIGFKPSGTDMTNAKKLFHNIESLHRNIEDLNDKSELLMGYSACPSVRDAVVNFQNRYTKLISNAQNIISQMQKNIVDQTELIGAKDDFSNWIKNSESILEEGKGFGTLDQLNEKLKLIENLLTHLPEGDLLLNKLQENFARVLTVVSSESQEGIKGEIAALTEKYSKLRMNINKTISDIKVSRQRWNDFTEIIQSIDGWCNEKMKILNEKTGHGTTTIIDGGDLKYRSELYKTMLREILDKKKEIENLKSEGNDLSIGSKTQNPNDQIKKLENKYNNLLNFIQDLESKAKSETDACNEFRNLCQEAEKWILQTSFRLMTNNSLCITNQEQTKTQIGLHDQLLNEMEGFHNNILNIESKGEEQIEKYKNNFEGVRNQVKNIKESYDALMKTGKQIKDRLQDSLKVFAAYEQTLLNIMNNLDEWEPIVNTTIQEPIIGKDEVDSKLEKIRNFHNKIQVEKTRLNLAVQNANSAAASLSRPSSPQDALLQPIPDEELTVRSRLEDFIDLLQKEVSDLSSALTELDKIKSKKEDMEKWINDSINIINNISQQPLRQRPESMEAEFKVLNDLRSNAAEKLMNLQEIEMEERGIVTEIYKPELCEKLLKLQENIQKCIDEKQKEQETVADYQQIIKDFQQLLSNLGSKLNSLEKGNGIPLPQKLKGILELMDGLNPAMETLNEIKLKANETLKEKSDDRFHEDQLKGIENRFNSLKKRIENRKKILDNVKDTLDGFLISLQECSNNVQDKKNNPIDTKIGFEVNRAEEMNNEIRNKLKEIERMEIKILTLGRRFDGLKGELEDTEIEPIINEMDELITDIKKINEEFKKYNQIISDGILLRKKFKDTLDAVKLRLSNFSKEITENNQTPFLTSTLERKINDLKRFGRIALEDLDTSFGDLFQQANALERDCNEIDSKKLRPLIGTLKDEIVSLSKKAGNQIEILEKSLKEQKGFDNEIEGIKSWIEDTLISIQSQDTSVIKPTQIPNQIQNYQKIQEDGNEKLKQIINLSSSPIRKRLNQPNQQQFDDTIGSVQRPIERLMSDIIQKINKLKSQEKSLNEINELIQAHQKFIDKIKLKLEELRKNFSLNKVEVILGHYEELSDSLQEQKKSLDLPQYEEYRNLNSFLTILKEEDLLLEEIDGNISRMRKLLQLQHHYLGLKGDITNFTTRYRPIVDALKTETGSPESKIKKCDEIVRPLQEAEAKLSSAGDKASEIMDEIGVEERNIIVKDLEDMKHQIQSIKNDVEARKSEYENLAIEHRKAGNELEKSITLLSSKEGEIKSRPLLGLGVTDCESEVEQHEKLVKEIGSHLFVLEGLVDTLKGEQSLPSTIVEKLDEAKSFLKRIPDELLGRGKYFDENKESRDKFQRLKDIITGWSDDAEKLLQSSEEFGDCENIGKYIKNIQEMFGVEKEMFPKLQNLRHILQSILPSLSNNDQNIITNEYEILNERVNNLFNKAKSRELELEKNESSWDNYLELKNSLEGILNEILIPGDLGSTLTEIKSNGIQIKTSLTKLEDVKSLFNNFKKEAEPLHSISNPTTKNKISNQIQLFEKKIQEINNNLEEKSKSCELIISRWEKCEKLWTDFEVNIVSIEDKFSQIDPFLKSQRQLEETKIRIGSILDDGKKLEPSHNELCEYAGYIIQHLQNQKTRGVQESSLQGKLDQLTQHYKTILKLLEEKLAWLNSQDKFLAEVDDTIEKLNKRIIGAKSDLNEIKPYSSDVELTNNKIKKIENEGSDISKTLNELIGKLEKKFSGLNQPIPPGIRQKISSLEIDLEKLEVDLKRLRSDVENGEELNTKYKSGLNILQTWVKNTEEKLEKEYDNPELLKENLQGLFQEVPNIIEEVENLKRNGLLLAQRTPNNEERANITTTINTIEKEILNIKSSLESRKQQVGESLDAWHRFLQLYSIVLNTIEEQKKLLQSPLVVSSLTESREKLSEFSMSGKSLNKLRHQLNQLGELYGKCGEVGGGSKLLEKLTYIEQYKTEIETEIVGKCSLLQELTDEWDRCEKKVKEINLWIEKSKNGLESTPTKRKPLRDQLASKENLLADILNQKIKLGLNLEKLEVHFKSGVGSDSNIVNDVKNLENRLDEFYSEVKSLCSKFEDSLNEIDKLQEEIQSLRNNLYSTEQHLRHLMTSTVAVDKEKRTTEQAAWREKLSSIQSSIASKNQRITFLTQAASNITL